MLGKSENEKLNPKSDELVTIELGIRNAWREIPEIVVACDKSNHAVTSKSLGRCYAEYSCSICGYTYSVDSSD